MRRDGAPGMSTNDANLILLLLRELKSDVSDLKSDLADVKVEAKKTNGRLSKLELWRAGLEAVVRAHSWIRPAVVAFITGAGVACLTWFLTT